MSPKGNYLDSQVEQRIPAPGPRDNLGSLPFQIPLEEARGEIRSPVHMVVPMVGRGENIFISI